jgi:hypothetical protein
MTSIEFWQMFFAFLEKALPIGAGLFAAWIAYKTKQWEAMQRQAIENTEQAKTLIEENTRVTTNIKKDSDVLRRQLLHATAANSYSQGIAEGRSMAVEERRVADDLDRADAELGKSTPPK